MISTKLNTGFREELDSFIYPNRASDAQQMIVRSNPLDELDCVNHYGFGGRKNMNRDFMVLSLNDHSPGDETLFLAVQLMGTDAKIVHFDWSSEGVEQARARAKRFGVADRIFWCSGDFQRIHDLFTEKSGESKEKGPQFSARGKFDYVRCCGALNRTKEFHLLFDRMLEFLKPDGVLGMSCFGFYGREPYRQLQKLALHLGSDAPGVQEEINRLKELFVFLPEQNWTRLAFDNLLEEVRSMKDDAFSAHFLREDINGWTVAEIYELLERKNLDLANFARHTRMLYQPWFAQKDPNLVALMESLSVRDTQTVAEIVWNTIEEHVFWATRTKSARVDLNDWENVPFFNPVAREHKNWKKILRETAEGTIPQLTVKVSTDEKYSIDLPWNPQIRRMVELIDGRKTFKEIILQIREEKIGEHLGTEEILRDCEKFLIAAEFEDIILLRDKEVPLLPFTARTFES